MQIYSSPVINKSFLPKQININIINNKQLSYDSISLNNRTHKKVSFGAEIVIEMPKLMIQMRIRKLKKLGLSDFYAQRIARFDSDKYKKQLN